MNKFVFCRCIPELIKFHWMPSTSTRVCAPPFNKCHMRRIKVLPRTIVVYAILLVPDTAKRKSNLFAPQMEYRAYPRITPRTPGICPIHILLPRGPRQHCVLESILTFYVYIHTFFYFVFLFISKTRALAAWHALVRCCSSVRRANELKSWCVNDKDNNRAVSGTDRWEDAARWQTSQRETPERFCKKSVKIVCSQKVFRLNLSLDFHSERATRIKIKWMKKYANVFAYIKRKHSSHGCASASSVATRFCLRVPCRTRDNVKMKNEKQKKGNENEIK